MTFTEQQPATIFARICKTFEEAHEKKDAKDGTALPPASDDDPPIEKAYEQLWQQGINGLMLHPESNYFTEDGEYVVQRGKMTFEGATHMFR
ncbi:hypothetical protein AAVH_06500 [Aphelenchoides avenae]|nr:hypothetical protein AAVH_06500 [Aphelenchus avenae]